MFAYFKVMFFIYVLLINSSFANLPTPNSEPLPSYRDTQNSDTILTEKVQKKIRHHPSLKNQPISAASHRGVIILQGSVTTKEQELSAIETAKSVKGVKDVDSQLTITMTNNRNK